MTTVKSVRLPDDLMDAIRERADRERLDESTAIRQLLALGLQEYACGLYRAGEVTLRQAARIANVPVRRMLEILWDRGVQGNVTYDTQRRALGYALEALGDE